MKDQELVNALRYLCPGNFTCARCKYEPVCHGDGCAIIQKAADRIANQSTHIAALQQEIEKLRGRMYLRTFWNERRQSLTKRGRLDKSGTGGMELN